MGKMIVKVLQRITFAQNNEYFLYKMCILDFQPQNRYTMMLDELFITKTSCIRVESERTYYIYEIYSKITIT